MIQPMKYVVLAGLICCIIIRLVRGLLNYVITVTYTCLTRDTFYKARMWRKEKYITPIFPTPITQINRQVLKNRYPEMITVVHVDG